MAAALSFADRANLRAALLTRYPWPDATDHGPRSVEAGECDRCGAEARLVLTCGPGAVPSLGRRCATDAGTAAWCAGHVADAEAALSWLHDLPDEADDVARLWWVACGEIDVDPALLARGGRWGLPVGRRRRGPPSTW